MKTKMKYMGTFTYEIDYENSSDTLDDIDEDIVMCWVNEEDFDDVYSTDFMRVDSDTFDGIMGETNTSALGIKLSDCGEQAKIWRIW